MTKAEQKRIRDFVQAFNRMEDRMRRELNAPSEQFHKLVKAYCNLHPYWEDGGHADGMAKIRNLLAHKSGVPESMAVPTSATVSKMKALSKRFCARRVAGTTFHKRVVTLEHEHSVRSVLQLINKHDFSQFPVVTNSRVVGLLTENGLTRWLAKHVHEGTGALQLDRQTVRDVLRQQEDGVEYVCAPAATFVDEVGTMFRKKPTLEAVIVTDDGGAASELVGIATRWDVLKLR